MSTFIPPAPAATKSAEQQEEPFRTRFFQPSSLQGSEVDFRTGSRPK